MYCCTKIYISTPKYVIQTACTRSQTISIQYDMGTAPRTAPRPLTVLIPGSHRVPPLVSTRRKVLSLPKTFAGSRRPLTGHQRVHRLLNAQPCALTVFHRSHEIYHTVSHGRLSQRHVTATLANDHYTVQYGHRHTNGSITASYRPHILLPSSYRVITVCHRLYPPDERF